jgi:hypothetical protein
MEHFFDFLIKFEFHDSFNCPSPGIIELSDYGQSMAHHYRSWLSRRNSGYNEITYHLRFISEGVYNEADIRVSQILPKHAHFTTII